MRQGGASSPNLQVLKCPPRQAHPSISAHNKAGAATRAAPLSEVTSTFTFTGTVVGG